jgi:hypothetical protein
MNESSDIENNIKAKKNESKNEEFKNESKNIITDKSLLELFDKTDNVAISKQTYMKIFLSSKVNCPLH